MSFLSDEIAILVLAAGKGSRLGGGKLLLPWRNEPLVCHAVRTALASSNRYPVFVVAGYEGDKVREALGAMPGVGDSVIFVENPEWSHGQSASLQAGLRAISQTMSAERLQGVMVMLGDQPLVSAATLDLLAEQHLLSQRSQEPCLATAPEFNGSRGNPVVLSSALFPPVAELRGDTGAKGILAELGSRLLKVRVEDAGVVHDVDSRDDYDKLVHA